MDKRTVVWVIISHIEQYKPQCKVPENDLKKSNTEVWRTPRPGFFTPKKRDPVPIVGLHDAGWVSGPVWMGPENIAPTGVRTPESRYTNYAIPVLWKLPLAKMSSERRYLQGTAMKIKHEICSQMCANVVSKLFLESDFYTDFTLVRVIQQC